MGLFSRSKEMVNIAGALPGRDRAIAVTREHLVLHTRMVPPFPDGFERAIFALGCFWGAERLFWLEEGMFTTAVGYAGGYTPNPTYEEVCSGQTGHAEAVLCVFDPAKTSFERLVTVFFEGHDPTQGMRQGNDRGTQYRSGIYTMGPTQHTIATQALATYDQAVRNAGYSEITTEIAAAGPFYYAEEYHQQYLAANPAGYCGLGGTGVSCPVGLAGRSHEG